MKKNDTCRQSSNGAKNRLAILDDRHSHGVRLPLDGGHDFGQGCSSYALHRRDDLGFLDDVFGLLAGFLAPAVFFAALVFLAGVRFVFGCETSGADAFLTAVEAK